MTDAFRDYQTRSTLLAERERGLDGKRMSVQELRQQVAFLQNDNNSRHEQLQTERQKFASKKAAQDEKVNVKETQIRAQQDRLQMLTEEEERLSAAIASCDKEIDAATAQIEKRQDLDHTMREVKGRVTQLKYELEEKDAKLMKLETRLARQEMATDKRHASLAERQPDFWFPRVSEADKYNSLEETAGESILLVDEMA